ncbi:MAG TPA: hypothetical protein VJ890_22515 [Vineibacter sp.]|nr:hypothetical protein [Vineibacter sp.]
MARYRDDAPPGGDSRFAEWEQRLYLRLSEIAAARKDRELFDQAKRSAESNQPVESRRSALRWVAAAQARAGLADDAIRTLDDGDDGGFASEEIALALAGAGRPHDASSAVLRLAAPEARVRALLRAARTSKDTRYLDQAASIIRELEDGYQQSELRPPFVIAYAELGRIDDALRLVRSIAVSYHRALALAGIASLSRDHLQLAEARSYATGFDGRGQEDEVWAALAQAETALGLLDGARKTLETHLPAAPSRPLAAAAGELAAAFWLKDDVAAAETLLESLLAGSWAIGEARAVLARRLIAVGRFADARRVSFLADEITFDNLSAEIALRQAATGAFREALETADKIQHPGRRSPTLAEIAAMMPD